MKKSLLVLVTLMMASSVFAREFTGQILNLNQDEEGMKVVVQEEKQSNSPVLLYLDSKSKDFTKTVAELNEAKTKEVKVKITTTNDSLAQIIKVQVLVD
jgi:hypothetical protein